MTFEWKSSSVLCASARYRNPTPENRFQYSLQRNAFLRYICRVSQTTNKKKTVGKKNSSTTLYIFFFYL